MNELDCAQCGARVPKKCKCPECKQVAFAITLIDGYVWGVCKECNMEWMH